MVGWFRDLRVLAGRWTWDWILWSVCLGRWGGRVSFSWSFLVCKGLPCGHKGLILLPHYLYIVIIHLERTAIRDWLNFSSALLNDLRLLGSWRGDVRLWMVADLIWRTAFCVNSAQLIDQSLIGLLRRWWLIVAWLSTLDDKWNSILEVLRAPCGHCLAQYILWRILLLHLIACLLVSAKGRMDRRLTGPQVWPWPCHHICRLNLMLWTKLLQCWQLICHSVRATFIHLHFWYIFPLADLLYSFPEISLILSLSKLALSLWLFTLFSLLSLKHVLIYGLGVWEFHRRIRTTVSLVINLCNGLLNALMASRPSLAPRLRLCFGYDLVTFFSGKRYACCIWCLNPATGTSTSIGSTWVFIHFAIDVCYILMLNLVSDTCRERFAAFANHGSRSADLLLGAGPRFDKVASLDASTSSVLINGNHCWLSVINYLCLSPLFLMW